MFSFHSYNLLQALSGSLSQTWPYQSNIGDLITFFALMAIFPEWRRGTTAYPAIVQAPVSSLGVLVIWDLLRLILGVKPISSRSD